MRVTSRQVSTQSIEFLGRAQSEMLRAQGRIATGQRINSLSEDPASAAGILDLSNRLRDVEQYISNAGESMSRTTIEENAVNQMTDIVTRAKELAAQVAAGTTSAGDRLIVKAEVDQLIQTGVMLANTKHGGAYLFGGDQSLTAPFTLMPGGSSFTTTAPSGAPRLEIGPGQFLVSSHPAPAVFGTATSGPMKTLADLSAALQANDPAAISATIPGLDAAFDTLGSVLGDIGARDNTARAAKDGLSAQRVALTEQQSTLQGIDIGEAAADFARRQASYQAALSATQRLLSLNLNDYLK